MSDITTISATQRERVGKGSARAARRAGEVPAVIYGDKKEPLGIILEAREITKLVNQPGIFGRLLDITVNGKKNTVLTRDIQFHPVTDVVMHMDFLRVSGSAKVAVAVAVEFINEDQCPALKIGDSIHISAIELPEGVEPTITDRDFTVATLQSPGGGVKNEDEEETEATEEEAEEDSSE